MIINHAKQHNHAGLATILGVSAMQEYEYIVLGDDRRPVLVVAQVHLNDITAIRSAAAFANGRGFEVWRDFDCIAIQSHPAAATA